MKFIKNPIIPTVPTQKFGEWPEHYKQYNMDGHNGIDLKTCFSDTPKGRREVYAVMDGKVSEIAISNKGYGNFIRLMHLDESQTIYGHLYSLKVKRGQSVKAGDIIAISDNTGDSTGPHLHFGYRPPNMNYENGYKGYIDPEPFFV